MELLNFKLSCVVVTYYPDVENLILNIRRYIDYIDKLIIWENTPKKDRDSYKIKIPDYSDKIIYLGTDNNEAIAFALNRSVEWSLQNGYTYILTMDQDSYWINFEYFRKKIIEYSSDKDIGIFAANVYEEEDYIARLPDIEVVHDAITSGTIYELDMFSNIGMFREDYSIDAVDLEFCYWAKRNGYNTVRLGKSLLKQRYGDLVRHSFFLRKVGTTNYSPFRLFHIVRNHIFLWYEYPEISRFQKKRILRDYIVLKVLKIIFYEKNKFKKISAILKGIIHGLLHIGDKPRKIIKKK